MLHGLIKSNPCSLNISWMFSFTCSDCSLLFYNSHFSKRLIHHHGKVQNRSCYIYIYIYLYFYYTIKKGSVIIFAFKLIDRDIFPKDIVVVVILIFIKTWLNVNYTTMQCLYFLYKQRIKKIDFCVTVRKNICDTTFLTYQASNPIVNSIIFYQKTI